MASTVASNATMPGVALGYPWGCMTAAEHDGFLDKLEKDFTYGQLLAGTESDNSSTGEQNLNGWGTRRDVWRYNSCTATSSGAHIRGCVDGGSSSSSGGEAWEATTRALEEEEEIGFHHVERVNAGVVGVSHDPSNMGYTSFYNDGFVNLQLPPLSASGFGTPPLPGGGGGGGGGGGVVGAGAVGVLGRGKEGGGGEEARLRGGLESKRMIPTPGSIGEGFARDVWEQDVREWRNNTTVTVTKKRQRCSQK